MTDPTTALPATPAGGDSTEGNAGVQSGPPCVNDPGNLACARRMIAVDKLAAHPGNVREDLQLSAEF